MTVGIDSEALLVQLRETERIIGQRITIELRSNGSGRMYTDSDRGKMIADFRNLDLALIALHYLRQGARDKANANRLN